LQFEYCHWLMPLSYSSFPSTNQCLADLCSSHISSCILSALELWSRDWLRQRRSMKAPTRPRKWFLRSQRRRQRYISWPALFYTKYGMTWRKARSLNCRQSQGRCRSINYVWKWHSSQTFPSSGSWNVTVQHLLLALGCAQSNIKRVS